MGKPLLLAGDLRSVSKEHTQGSETSQYLEEEKPIMNVLFCRSYFGRQDKTFWNSLSSGERNGNSPNRFHASENGVVGQ